jgi:hypothetical protein
MNAKIYKESFPLLKQIVDLNYSMLLERPWLRDADVAHD